jgi:hypothetical protein
MTMVICFKCSSGTKKTLDELIASRAFADYSELIAAAIDNLAVLHEEVDKAGAVIIGSDAGAERIVKSRSPKPEEPRSTLARPAAVERLPELFGRPSVAPAVPAALAPLPDDVFLSGQAVPIDRWIFGQFSKLLPAKASCRALVRSYPAPPRGFDIDKVAARIAQEAAALGEYLAGRDRHRASARDDAWAVGFPSVEDKADRSRLRYANQFVGNIGKQGALTGLLIDLKLINVAKSDPKRILLTRVGWEFGVAENPALDGGGGDGKFTADEIQFLLEHIQRHVPVEDFAFRTILAAIRSGQDTPEKLDEACKHHVPAKRRNEITKVVITTQRTGVVSRMVDLGLVSRKRDGVRVSYVVTELGNRYADRSAAA